MAYGRNIHDSQNVYIHGERLMGVQSCSVGWAPQEGYVNAIGRGFIGSAVEGSLQSTFDVERLMVGPRDPLIDLLEKEYIEGEIEYGEEKNFSFKRGHVNSYSCSCSVGQIPSLNFGISAFGESGGGLSADPHTPPVDDTILIAHPGSIVIDVNGESTNRVQSFDVTVNISREPYHVLGQLEPEAFILQFPVQVDCQFVLHIDDYESASMLDFVCLPTVQDLTFFFNDCATGEYIRKLFVKGARLVDYQQRGGIGEALEATLTYKSLLNGSGDLKKVVSGESF
jgi:hypothetical protein